MEDAPASEVTALLRAWSAGDPDALNSLVPIVYEELRRLARSHMRRERDGHTLPTTGLIHEAFLRLVDQDRVNFRDRLHFFGTAAGAMRRVLIDHARSRQSAKRGGESLHIPLENAGGLAERYSDVLHIHDCLCRLSAVDERQGRIVELRFFGGLSIEETAEVVGVSPMTVKREWAVARAWLYRELGGGQ